MSFIKLPQKNKTISSLMSFNTNNWLKTQKILNNLKIDFLLYIDDNIKTCCAMTKLVFYYQAIIKLYYFNKIIIQLEIQICLHT